MATTNKGLRAWRMIYIIRKEQINICKQLTKVKENKSVERLVLRHDQLERRKNICNKYL